MEHTQRFHRSRSWVGWSVVGTLLISDQFALASLAPRLQLYQFWVPVDVHALVVWLRLVWFIY